MPIIKPALSPVKPGQPVTAQGWNEIVSGLGDLYDAVLAFGTGTVEVRVVSGEQPLQDATVVAAPLTGGGPPVAGLPPHGDVSSFVLAQLTPGAWRVFVRAPGFKAQTVDVTVPVKAPVVVSLALAGVRVPDLFGVGAQAAFAQLAAAKLSVDLIFDVLGREVARSPLPAQYQNRPILAQLPAAGTVVDPATQRLRLVVAAALEQTPVVTMPSLIGLSLGEVNTVLNQLGLVLGTVTTRSGPGGPPGGGETS
jgi:hypothetical protein